jgi:uncharacterized membrane protein YgcG
MTTPPPPSSSSSSSKRMNNSSFILGIIVAIYVINIITSLPLCSGTVEQQCRQRRLFEDDSYAGIIIDPKGILNDDTKRIITDKLQQYSSPEFYYESSSAVNNNNNVGPSESAKVANQTVRVTTTDDYKNDDIDNDENIVDNHDVDCHNSEKCITRGVQFAVAIVDDTTFRFNNDYDYDFGSDLLQHDNDNGNNNNNYNAEIMAEYVAKTLHNRLWDVRFNKEEEEEERIETKKGTNKRGMTTLPDHDTDANILIYLDIRDRVVFISVDNNNPNLRRILTDKRIDRIIRNEMKPYFKNDDYGNGLIKGMEQIVDLLKNDGEDDDKQSIMILETILLDFFGWFNDVFGCGGGGFLWMTSVMLHCYYHLKLKQRERQQQQQRIYAKTASELSAQDIIHAEKLRKTYAKTTNCPICLEDFQTCCIGSDSRPIKTLRCGHVFDESCFLEWITYGHGGDITKCPICRSDVGGSNTNTNKYDNDSDNGDENNYDDSGTTVGNRERNVARLSYTFNRASPSPSPLMARSRSLFTNTSSDDNNDDGDDSITTNSSGDSYYAFGGGDDGGSTTTSVGGRGGRF